MASYLGLKIKNLLIVDVYQIDKEIEDQNHIYLRSCLDFKFVCRYEGCMYNAISVTFLKHLAKVMVLSSQNYTIVKPEFKSFE